MKATSAALFALLAVIGLRASAQAETDLKPVADYLRPFVQELRESVVVWSWFEMKGHEDHWKTVTDASSPLGLARLQARTKPYWQEFCSGMASQDPSDCDPNIQTRQNYWGNGLYLASDPLTSAGYGGGEDWAVMQIRLPKKMRVAVVQQLWTEDIQVSPPSPEVLETLENMGCRELARHHAEAPKKSGGFADSAKILMEAFAGANGFQSHAIIDGKAEPTCLLSVRRLLKDELKIQAVYYYYHGTDFPVCEPAGAPLDKYKKNKFRAGAFVLTSDRGIGANDVKVFNPYTRQSFTDRLRIQSFSYESYLNLGAYPEFTGEIFAAADEFLAHYIPLKWPGYSLGWGDIGATRKQGQFVDLTFEICQSGSNGCLRKILAGPLPIRKFSHPVRMIAQDRWTELPLFIAPVKHSLWSDLTGHLVDPHLEDWMRKNLMGCQGKPNLVPLPAGKPINFVREVPWTD